MNNATPTTEGKLVFTSKGPNETLSIYTVDADGNNFKQLLHMPAREWGYHLSLSPDGKTILFLAGRDGIQTINIDGTEHKLLIPDQWNCSAPCFSPDGKKIAFMNSSPSGWMISLMNSDGSGIRQITRQTDYSRVHYNPVFTADGSRIIYEAGSLCITDISTGETKSIFSGKSPDYHQYQHVAVSPDGRKMAFEAGMCLSVDEDDYEWLYTIFTSNLDGSGRTKLSEGLVTATTPLFSPDGRMLAFVGSETEKYRDHLYIVKLDGSKPINVTKDFDDVYGFAFSPDGSRMAFIGQRSDEKGRHIFTIGIDGSDVRQITGAHSGLVSLCWSPNRQ